MNRNEILRYLRTSTSVDDKRLFGLIDECEKEIERTVVPKTLHRIFDCSVSDESIIAGGVKFESTRLAETVKGCDRICIFGATLGTECDRLLRTYSPTDIARAAVMQACLAAKIEEVCDALENDLKAQGLRLRQRYSPGYYDLDITENRKIFEMLELTKRIGLTLTDSMQMLPTKSVTAIIGIEND